MTIDPAVHAEFRRLRAAGMSATPALAWARSRPEGIHPGIEWSASRHATYLTALGYLREDARRAVEPEQYIITVMVDRDDITLADLSTHGFDVPDDPADARRQFIDRANELIAEAVDEAHTRLTKLAPRANGWVMPTPEQLAEVSDEDLLELSERARRVYEDRAAERLAAKVRRLLASDAELAAELRDCYVGDVVKVTFNSYDWDNGWFYHAGDVVLADAQGHEMAHDFEGTGRLELDMRGELADLSLGGEHTSRHILILDVITGAVEHAETD